MRIALGIEYNGANYFGWQRQQQVDSIQQRLELALSKVANEDIHLFCAGRTDSGVHATGQVVHFDTQCERQLQAWYLGVNANLPSDIKVRWAKEVTSDFHARFSATARRYRYIIYNNPLRPAILADGLTHYHIPLNHEKMHQAGQSLLGERDFSSFRAAQCQSHTPWRYVHHLIVYRIGEYVIVDIKANAFVHHMVRNIVGSLLEVGNGNQPVEWLSWLQAQCNRTLAPATAKPNGLYLVSVDYPAEFMLPQTPLGPLFLPD
ncbi:tRNA pseudouridine(38-40) synthase TruA [Spirabiliibacterium falconis]|uniref:tRNA pseudouridine(38-40) synthase TruA n=1 Tax=Spirabiliibacterium falconis TaxID=572023 RepID=UPI001AAD5377|nr:tRNA pseudouridine(38-40) synthase TruA [Spirabiliibacterium falconis]MBE2894149.1 tRNA pseudouridine(38-40) synthase TruA [Spirabiliibacterium falconis]